jgi:hypothetical protein
MLHQQVIKEFLTDYIFSSFVEAVFHHYLSNSLKPCNEGGQEKKKGRK